MARGHSVTVVDSVDDVPLSPLPDVIVHEPLEKCSYGVAGSCALASRFPEQTLLLAVFCDIGPSRAMFLHHAMAGRCHPRMLLHWPGNDDWWEEEGQGLMERAVAREPIVERVAVFPSDLDFKADCDLGVLMDRKGFRDFLHLAAVHTDWGSFADLDKLLNVAKGVSKNTSSKLGTELKRRGLVAADRDWTAQRLKGLVSSHRSFILAYGQGHLGLPRPTAPIWDAPNM